MIETTEIEEYEGIPDDELHRQHAIGGDTELDILDAHLADYLRKQDL